VQPLAAPEFHIVTVAGKAGVVVCMSKHESARKRNGSGAGFL